MDDAPLVRRFEGLRDLRRDCERLVDRDRAGRDAAIQTLAVHEFEHEELLAVGFIETGDGADVRMIEGGEDLCLAAEARDAIWIVGERGGEDLEGHVATKLRVFRAVDLANAACADPSDDLICAEAAPKIDVYGVRPTDRS